MWDWRSGPIIRYPLGIKVIYFSVNLHWFRVLIWFYGTQKYHIIMRTYRDKCKKNICRNNKSYYWLIYNVRALAIAGSLTQSCITHVRYLWLNEKKHSSSNFHLINNSQAWLIKCLQWSEYIFWKWPEMLIR